MSRRAYLLCSWSLIFAAVIICTPNQRAQTGQSMMRIVDPPRDGISVGKSMTVKGTASIPSGNHLWVLAHRIDFEDFWWPQGEGRIDPATKEWRVSVTFGEPGDIGWEFEIAVIVVNEEQHTVLREYRRQMMSAPSWKPREMPPTTPGFPPQIRKVKKESHS